MQIFKSRFTPKATGDEVSLLIGEKVKYQLKDGKVVEAIINSERMGHNACPNLGYEATMLDNNEKRFLDGKRIVWWDGKMDSMEQLNSAMEK